jgi:deoxyuridine 5'-triphosphate nucleotidohydrolase
MNLFLYDKLNNENGYILGLILLNIDNDNYSDDNIICNFKKDSINDNIKDILKFIGNITYNINNIQFLLSNKDIINNIKNIISSNDLRYPSYNDIINNNHNYLGIIKALFEFYGNISYNNYESYAYISYKNEKLINNIKDKINIPSIIIKGDNIVTLKYDNVNCIDFLGLLYHINDIFNENELFDKYLYKKFINIINNNNNNDLPKIKIYKSDNNAILPSKSRTSDAGYDLTIINEVKTFNNKTKLYDTGIKLDIPNGYYIEVFPRSSLSKSGYMLANSVGIIDQGYRGNIYIALTKIDESSKDLELPFKCCQMILKKQYYSTIKQTFDDLIITDRNVGGYGSTN